MDLSHLINAIQLSPQSQTVKELLDLNEKTKEYGLVLTPGDVKSIITSRNKVLHDYARVELSNEVLKELIEVYAASPYMDQNHYVETLNDLQEIFYYLRNETEDKISDVKLIDQIIEYFNGPCAGSVVLVRSEMESLAENFRSDLIRGKTSLEGDDKTWN
ncbi:DUF6323 family protein [Sporosarcina sp. Te-1]|uniref:DUF6323 family protein n=1 Tax=Sporosarcina sp. Te-1 TaxID=2818390 RepID=UPI001A9D5D7B|nr:DUF6323 family protein [Sporosarcina sp. Te-1]QTD40366.1 hypothetical protein J3U78_16510 [Sporosarcina sp. Te-1]